MQLVHHRTVDAPRARRGQPWWGRLAMALLRPGLWAIGYTFRSGRGREFERDAAAVLDASWTSTPEPAEVHRMYLQTATWVLAYRRGQPVGCMGLYDVREISFTLNYLGARWPQGLQPARYRDLARLAIVPSARGGASVVMLGLLHEMVARCRSEGATHILAISVPSLFGVFARFNPSARPIELEPSSVPVSASIRETSYTCDLDGFDALRVIVSALLRPVGKALSAVRRRLRGGEGQHDGG